MISALGRGAGSKLTLKYASPKKIQDQSPARGELTGPCLGILFLSFESTFYSIPGPFFFFFFFFLFFSSFSHGHKVQTVLEQPRKAFKLSAFPTSPNIGESPIQ